MEHGKDSSGRANAERERDNGDGRDDILWRNDDGSLTNWLGTSNGGFVSNGAASSYVVTMQWKVVDVGDYHGDGRDDILWRHSTGTVTNWLATPTGAFTINDANAYSEVPTSWHVVGGTGQ